MPGQQQTIEQARAKSAWDKVAPLVNEPWAKEYRALVRSTAADILTNGLGQTLAFLRAKAKDKHTPPHWTLYQHLSEWITSKYVDDATFKPDGLLEWLIQQDSDVYRQTTVEVIAYLNWLKRFAEAILPEGEA